MAVKYLTKGKNPSIDLLVVKCGHVVFLVSIGDLLPKSTANIYLN